MMEETVAFGEVDNVDMYSVHELECILHAEVEPLQVSVAVCVVSHEAVEGVVGPHAHLVQICCLEVRIEGQDRLGRVSVERHDLALCICDRGGLRPGARAGIDRCFQICGGCQRTLLHDSIPCTRVATVIFGIRVLSCRSSSD